MKALLTLHGSAQDEHSFRIFVNEIAPETNWISPRGQFRLGNGFTFFNRRPDRSIDQNELLLLAEQFLSETDEVVGLEGERVYLAGFSSGAIFAEALLSVSPERFEGAILLRPEPIAHDFTFQPLQGKPILVLSGRFDDRRDPQDAAQLASQLRFAGADVTLHVLDTGHDWEAGGADSEIAKLWLADQF